MSKRKPVRGQCDVCGCAVVAPGRDDLAARRINLGCDTFECNGHRFADFLMENRQELVSVRCPTHGGRGFPPAPGPQRDCTNQDNGWNQPSGDKWAGGRHKAR